jgi:hypothetical protein
VAVSALGRTGLAELLAQAEALLWSGGEHAALVDWQEGARGPRAAQGGRG